MTAVPNTYSEWVTVLTDFKNKKNDEDVLRAMKAGSIQWQSGVAERFSRKLIEAVNFRMNAASDKFQKDLSRCLLYRMMKESIIWLWLLNRRIICRNRWKILRKMTEAEECPALSEITG